MNKELEKSNIYKGIQFNIAVEDMFDPIDRGNGVDVAELCIECELFVVDCMLNFYMNNGKKQWNLSLDEMLSNDSNSSEECSIQLSNGIEDFLLKIAIKEYKKEYKKELAIKNKKYEFICRGDNYEFNTEKVQDLQEKLEKQAETCNFLNMIVSNMNFKFHNVESSEDYDIPDLDHIVDNITTNLIIQGLTEVDQISNFCGENWSQMLDIFSVYKESIGEIPRITREAIHYCIQFKMKEFLLGEIY